MRAEQISHFNLIELLFCNYIQFTYLQEIYIINDLEFSGNLYIMFIEFLAKQNEYVQQLYARLLIEKALLALSNHLIFTISGEKNL